MRMWEQGFSRCGRAIFTIATHKWGMDTQCMHAPKSSDVIRLAGGVEVSFDECPDRPDQ